MSAPNPKETALRTLLVRYLPRLAAFVRARQGSALQRRAGISDVVQGIAARVLAGEAQFEYQDEASFREWLFTAARRELVDQARYHRAGCRDLAREISNGACGGEEEHLVTLFATGPRPSAVQHGREQFERLERALDTLSTDDRDLLLAVRVLEMQHQEVAAALSISPATARQRVHRATARLLVHLDSEA